MFAGLVPGRDDDTTAFGLAYGKFSAALAGLDFERLLEWSHTFVLVPSTTVQPVAQYIIRPGGTGDIANVLVLGTQSAINF